ncbi:MAG: hypothetical protein ACOC2F_04515 [Bacteroidota bacterium]
MAKTLSRIKEIEITVIEQQEEGFAEKNLIITVAKVPLGKWKQLTDNINTLLNLLPEVLEEQGLTEKEELERYFEQISTQDVLMLLPDMMEVAFDEVINILAMGTDVDRDLIAEQVGIDEALEILEAIIEVNNLVKVVEKGKNMMNLLTGLTGRS